MSVLQDVYEVFHKRLLECGATRDEADEVIEEARALDNYLNNRICPQCKNQIPRVLDFHQAGFSLAVGSWFKYHCKKCNFFICRIESEEKSN